MSFRLFGVTVEIQLGFWITAVLLGLRYLQDPAMPKATIAVWVLVVLVSVLVHEFGHAFAFKRHAVDSAIVLHWMGGHTVPLAAAALRRFDHIFISLAGPFAGFALAGAVHGLRILWPSTFASLPQLGAFAVDALIQVNLLWGLVNLVPVLPLDGGHVLGYALGPARARTAAMVSVLASVAVATFFFQKQMYIGTLLFGMFALQNMQQLWSMSSGSASGAGASPGPADPPAAASAKVSALLRQARLCLDQEDTAGAKAHAEEALQALATVDTEGAPPVEAVKEALEVIAWAELLAGHADAAFDTLQALQQTGRTDPALAGAVLFARRELVAARRILEMAFAEGDHRKSVAGPLIQILIEDGEVARAAAIAYRIVDALSEDDARTMAKIAFDAGAFKESAELSEAMFRREGQPDDAYEAARALARKGDHAKAIEFLRRAVAAGFRDHARAWSDNALEALRAEQDLAAVLPKP